MTRTLIDLCLLCIVAVALAGCGSDSTPETDVRVPATAVWSLQPQTILPIVPHDMKVTDGGIVWIADDVKDGVPIATRKNLDTPE